MSRRRVLNRREQYLKTIEETPEESRASLQFFTQLKYFYKRKWGVSFVPPSVNGVEIDLHKLYTAVKSLGGWQRVTNAERWSEVAREALDLGEETLSADYCARLTYMRFLSKFEQCEQQGDTEDHENEMMGSRSRVRGYSLYVTSECPISTHKKEIPDSLPQYDRLIKSLSSGLPNEIDFSLNACVLMSVRGPYALQLDGHPNLIPLIVAQAGVFDDESSYLQTQFVKVQSRLDRDFEHFWSGVGIEDADVLNLFTVKSVHYSKTDGDQFPLLRDVGQTQKSLQVVRSRVLQVSDVIRNLSFEPGNQPFLTSNWAAFKFLLASMASDDYELRNNALDTISELASHITFTTEVLTRAFLRLLRSFVFADDRFLVMRSTEILGRLCTNSENEPAMCVFFDSPVLHRLFELVSAKDVLISVTTLDALYNMSESGRDFCEKLAEVPHAVELLFDFCTIEASQFFTEGLSGIKVIEYQASGQEHHVSQAIRQPIHHTAQFSPQVQQRVQPQLMGPPAAPRPHVVVSAKGEVATNKPVLAAQLACPVLHQTLAAKSTTTLNGTTRLVESEATSSTYSTVNDLPTTLAATALETSTREPPISSDDPQPAHGVTGKSADEKMNGIEASNSEVNIPRVPNGTGDHQSDEEMAEDEHRDTKLQMNGRTKNGEKSEEQKENGVMDDDHSGSAVNGKPRRTRGRGKKRTAVDNSTEEVGETPTKKSKATPKKKLKNGFIEQKEVTPVVPPTPPAASPPPPTPVACIRVPNFMCEWNACTQYFHTGAAMIYHILNTHIEGNDHESTASEEEPSTQPKYPPGALIFCLWPGCERTPRSKWSLITHLQDHHCNENALNSAARKRRELGDFNYVARIKQTLSLETPPANHAGYSNFAAYEAIRRHAFQFMSRDLTEDHPEGPVTKDLRLTSALILRNLARHSAECRKRLRPYEGFMAYMAMSRLENGAALAQCLATLSTVETS